MQAFSEIVSLARENISRNPTLLNKEPVAVCRQYLDGLQDEVVEVRDEVKLNNQVYLTDELSDIAWDYACVLAQAERAGLIESAASVFQHGLEKYVERAPAFIKGDEKLWELVKVKQKSQLVMKHKEKYGN